jgi:hypothetical protein
LLYLAAFFGTLLIPCSADTIAPAQLDFFEKKVRPILIQRCYDCHSEEAGKKKGGLAVDARDSLLMGGDNGPAIIAGNPDKSLLIEAVRYQNRDMQMPPKSASPSPKRAGSPSPSVLRAPSTPSSSSPASRARAAWLPGSSEPPAR